RTNSTCSFPLIIRRRLATLRRIRPASCVWGVTWGCPLPLTTHRGPFCFNEFPASSPLNYFRIGVSFPRALIDDHGGVTARDPIQLRFIPCCRVARSPRSSPSQPRQNGDADDGDRDDDDGRLGEQPSDTLDHAAEEGRGEVRLHRPFE